MSGRTSNNRTENFPAAGLTAGTFADVTITSALAHTLRGELVGSPAMVGGA